MPIKGPGRTFGTPKEGADNEKNTVLYSGCRSGRRIGRATLCGRLRRQRRPNRGGQQYFEQLGISAVYSSVTGRAEARHIYRAEQMPFCHKDQYHANWQTRATLKLTWDVSSAMAQEAYMPPTGLQELRWQTY